MSSYRSRANLARDRRVPERDGPALQRQGGDDAALIFSVMDRKRFREPSDDVQTASSGVRRLVGETSLEVEAVAGTDHLDPNRIVIDENARPHRLVPVANRIRNQLPEDELVPRQVGRHAALEQSAQIGTTCADRREVLMS